MATEHAPPRVRRIYDDPDPDDGTRVLVDRLWPRGVAKDRAHVDEWLKAVAPSDELRRWYHKDRSRFPDFVRRYRAELSDGERAEAVTHLRELRDRGPLTLVTSATDVEHSHVPVIAEAVEHG
jgi:uncharacterized protein YeaO (DUF488 family)